MHLDYWSLLSPLTVFNNRWNNACTNLMTSKMTSLTSTSMEYLPCYATSPISCGWSSPKSRSTSCACCASFSAPSTYSGATINVFRGWILTCDDTTSIHLKVLWQSETTHFGPTHRAGERNPQRVKKTAACCPFECAIVKAIRFFSRRDKALLTTLKKL